MDEESINPWLITDLDLAFEGKGHAKEVSSN